MAEKYIIQYLFENFKENVIDIEFAYQTYKLFNRKSNFEDFKNKLFSLNAHNCE